MPNWHARWAPPKVGSKSQSTVFATRYRVLFMQEIAETVADPSEVDSEIRFLFLALKTGK